MLNKAVIKNFGPLPNGEYQFASGLNVIVGENGLGKSHLLKLLYTVLNGECRCQGVHQNGIAEGLRRKAGGCVPA